MALYSVIIRETRSRSVVVETDYDFEALSKVEDLYAQGKINLDDDSYLADFDISLEENK